MSGDPIGDALHADAEAARAEIRAAGISCPSCGVNMADLPDGHALAFAHTPAALFTAECLSGDPVPMSDAWFALWQAVASIQVWDDVNRRWDECVRKNIIGEGPANFTGLLGVLGGESAPRRK